MTDFSYPDQPRSWLAPLAFFAIFLIPLAAYLWYDWSRYDLPKLKPFNGAQEDLFAQIKCLTKMPENGGRLPPMRPVASARPTAGFG